MSHQEASEQSAPSNLLFFAFSVCLAMFFERQLHSLGALASDLAERHREGLLGSTGLYDLSFSELVWDVMLTAAAVYWLGKLFNSPVSRVLAALLGATIGCWIGLHH